MYLFIKNMIYIYIYHDITSNMYNMYIIHKYDACIYSVFINSQFPPFFVRPRSSTITQLPIRGASSRGMGKNDLIGSVGIGIFTYILYLYIYHKKGGIPTFTYVYLYLPTLQGTNIAGWKMDPAWVGLFPIQNWDIPASYVILPEHNWWISYLGKRRIIFKKWLLMGYVRSQEGIIVPGYSAGALFGMVKWSVQRLSDRHMGINRSLKITWVGVVSKNKTWNLNGKDEAHVLLCHWYGKRTSWELTYPLKSRFWRGFSFSQGEICIRSLQGNWKKHQISPSQSWSACRHLSPFSLKQGRSSWGWLVMGDMNRIRSGSYQS